MTPTLNRYQNQRLSRLLLNSLGPDIETFKLKRKIKSNINNRKNKININMKVDNSQVKTAYNDGERASEVKVETESNDLQREVSVIERDEPKIDIEEQPQI